MKWWHNTLFDTCSLITLDHILVDHGDFKKYFKGIYAIEECLTEDNLLAETSDRIRGFVEIRELPSPKQLSQILVKAKLSPKLAGIDSLVFACGVHHQLRIITGDKLLAINSRNAKIDFGNLAMVLRDLYVGNAISKKKCNDILESLLQKNDFIIGPQKMAVDFLVSYKFLGA